MKVLAISGSLRRDSHNTKLIRAAAELLPPGDELVEYANLALIPPFNEDDEAETPAAVVELKRELASADRVIFSTPEYNSSMPGQLKNALDWVSRPIKGNPLEGKRVVVLGASNSLFGAVWAQAELRKVLGALSADV